MRVFTIGGKFPMGPALAQSWVKAPMDTTFWEGRTVWQDTPWTLDREPDPPIRAQSMRQGSATSAARVPVERGTGAVGGTRVRID